MRFIYYCTFYNIVFVFNDLWHLCCQVYQILEKEMLKFQRLDLNCKGKKL